MRQFWHRLTNRDRLCYALVIAFGICLLTVSIFFQLGYKIGERQITPNPFIRNEPQAAAVRVLLLDEPSQIVRGIEIAISLGMITLGAERLKNYKRRQYENSN